MKNKTLTLILSVILLASIFTGCKTVVKKELKQELKVENIDETDINEEALDKAISKSILTTTERLDESELSTEGHVLLGVEIEKNIVNAYVIAAVSNYGIQNDTLTCIHSTSATPTVISYEINPENDRYTEISYNEADENTIETLFPKPYEDKAKNAKNYYSEIEKMQIQQAEAYLDFIDRDLPIKPFIKKNVIPILTNSNFSKQLPNFPTWEGSSEIFENGQRFIYSSEVGESETGKPIVICTKTDEEGNIIMTFSVDKNGSITKLEKNID